MAESRPNWPPQFITANVLRAFRVGARLEDSARLGRRSYNLKQAVNSIGQDYEAIEKGDISALPNTPEKTKDFVKRVCSGFEILEGSDDYRLLLNAIGRDVLQRRLQSPAFVEKFMPLGGPEEVTLTDLGMFYVILLQIAAQQPE